MSDAPRAVADLRGAAGFLFWATIVIVVDFRVGGGDGGVGIDVINDVIGAALVVPGVSRLRAGATDLVDASPWLELAWIAALLNVPLVLLEEATRVVGAGSTELGVVQLASAITALGGTFCVARVFELTIRRLGDPEGLADRWRRTGWWVLVFGGFPAVLTALGPLIGLVDETDRGDLIGLFAGAALLTAAMLAFGLIALIGLLTALSRTRQLPEPTPVPPNGSDASSS